MSRRNRPPRPNPVTGLAAADTEPGRVALPLAPAAEDEAGAYDPLQPAEPACCGTCDAWLPPTAPEGEPAAELAPLAQGVCRAGPIYQVRRKSDWCREHQPQ